MRPASCVLLRSYIYAEGNSRFTSPASHRHDWILTCPALQTPQIRLPPPGTDRSSAYHPLSIPPTASTLGIRSCCICIVALLAVRRGRQDLAGMRMRQIYFVTHRPSFALRGWKEACAFTVRWFHFAAEDLQMICRTHRPASATQAYVLLEAQLRVCRPAG